MMSEANSRKKPPKLKLNIQESQGDVAEVNEIHTATSVDSDLDSTVKVTVGDQADILISPESLVVTKQLGRGQYGIVEEVHHKTSGHNFAVKRVALRPGDENEQRRLLMDVDILVKGTQCKNIIKFFGALIWEGDLWILMELMDCSLDKFYRLAHADKTKIGDNNNKNPIKQLVPCTHSTSSEKLGNCDLCNPIPEKVLGRIAADILRALNYLYSIKVIHRDIKPSNILIGCEGIIKLCDFGISSYLVNSVARTYEAGCRPYMAPERIDPPRDRTGYDIKSDVWSFGITMLEIATGRYPYQQARDFFEQLKFICTTEPPKLTDGCFSHTFQDFLDSCLKRDYQLRPKYDSLEAHPFVVTHRNLEITDFTQRILAKEQESNKVVS